VAPRLALHSCASLYALVLLILSTAAASPTVNMSGSPVRLLGATVGSLVMVLVSCVVISAPRRMARPVSTRPRLRLRVAR
jgi:hypothetical protein